MLMLRLYCYRYMSPLEVLYLVRFSHTASVAYSVILPTELEIVDCTYELAFHIPDLYSGPE